MSKTKTYLKRGGLGLLIIILLVGGAGSFYFKSYLPNTVAPKSFPQIDGEIQLEGLDATVDIYRDQMDIAHIYASTEHDLFFAQGYVHAQERFWQMDYYRHVGEGRTAEMFGSPAAESDAFLATLGWRKTSIEEFASLSQESKDRLTAYAEGVNAYINGKSNEELSLEYAILGLPIINPDYVVEPWEPINTLAWAKALAWDLKSNFNDEIQRVVLMKTLSAEQISKLFPDYPDDHPTIVNNIGEGNPASGSTPPTVVDIPDKTLAALEYNASLLDNILGSFNDGIGSNSWVVSGNLTTTGKPLLANDPHLSIAMPSIWYQISLHCKPKTDQCPFDLAGFSLAGAPGIVLGHNDRIAWGFTYANEDVMDLFIERVNPENPNQYEVNGQWVDFDTRKEIINVGGGDAVEITVRSTRHGPVISDAYPPLMDEGDPNDDEFEPFKDRAGVDLPENYVIALSWTASPIGNPLTRGNPLEAIWGFNQAQNWEEFREAASIFHTPGHNVTYADVDGNIGYQTTGDIPIRKSGDGRIPVPGWSGEYDWIDIIPFEEMPYTLNPVEGYIASVNNQIVGNDYPYFITLDWDYGFRANRVVNLLESAPGKFDITYFQMMHADAYDSSAETYVPLLLQLNQQFAKPNEAIAFDSLKGWDYQARSDSQAAAVYEAFWRHLLKNTFNDELPERYWTGGGDRWFEVMRSISADSLWWDDITTPDVQESRDEIMRKSFVEGVAELEEMLGKDPADWTWGGIHVAIFRSSPLGESGFGFIDTLINRGPFAVSGGSSIVNATSWNSNRNYEVTGLPSMRAIYDMSDLNNSLTIHTTGQSGHAFHPHYIDMASLWADIEYYPMLWSEQAITSNAEGHLVLTPK
jgi:penicillin amidase